MHGLKLQNANMAVSMYFSAFSAGVIHCVFLTDPSILKSFNLNIVLVWQVQEVFAPPRTDPNLQVNTLTCVEVYIQRLHHALRQHPDSLMQRLVGVNRPSVIKIAEISGKTQTRRLTFFMNQSLFLQRDT